MHDGQNVFDNTTSYSGEWKVDELLNQHFEKTQRSMIVVAIEHGNEFRIEEYQPWEHSKYGVGKGKEYVDFLVQTIKPFIDKNYRTLPEASHTAILGSSMGGLISFYASLQYPDTFGKAGVFSPAFWIASPYLKSFVDTFSNQYKPKMYFLVGMMESEKMYAQSREIFEYLQQKEFKNITFVKRDDGKHTESFWSRESLSAINYLFPPYELYEELNYTKSFKIQLTPNNQRLFFNNQGNLSKLKLIVKKNGEEIIQKKWQKNCELNLQTFDKSPYLLVLKHKKKIIYKATLVVN